jgi:hypothetical protein
MPKNERTHAVIFQKCSAEGSFVALAEVDREHIKTLHDIALTDLGTIKEWSAKAPKASGQWNAILKLGYDVLHTLAEAFVYFDRIKAARHECLFAYLCERHPGLELDWNFLDRIRTLRNRSIYYGRAASHDDWKSIELQLILYINVLRKKVEEQLKS